MDKESGKVMGAAGFNVHDTPETSKLIYHFSKSAWGKGFATEAAAACVELAKKHPGTVTIFASADPDNTGSLKIL
ncbi:GNAT family N-acetyltransferase [Bacillus sp. FJAT-18017]|uniref:GNAT family N-acetyltransferase n=1 Tax=Bacillus sp. FJAT-18017 TaxID=1705566 RepID=UPI0006B04BF1|nr:GNAT family N-acetyltransferase [Bacillus sp. FJAT-18017]